MIRSDPDPRPSGERDADKSKDYGQLTLEAHSRLDHYLDRAPPDTAFSDIIRAFNSDKKPREVWPDE